MSPEPLSIETLLQKQREEKDAASKPRFMTKEQRAQVALDRRAQEIRAQTEREDAKKLEREILERETAELERHHRYGSGRHDGRDRDRYDYRRNGPPPSSASRDGFHNVPTGPRAGRSRLSGPPSSMPPPAPLAGADPSDTFVPALTENDLSAIRSRYLGVDKKKRKIRKMNDRKFVFDWDAQDDTLTEDSLSAVGSNRQGAQVMFGRGHLAGMDDYGGAPPPASKQRSGVGSTNATATATAAGVGTGGQIGATPVAPGETHLVDAMERRKAQKQGYDDRHWTEKPLQEMKERDWRIFREDFSISARGGNIPYPLRSWRESDIPESILECIERIGYKEPSPIQRQGIPIGLQNRDIIGIAETGSGKTAAFVIPMLAFISKLPIFTDENRHLGPYALIMAPTRELAQQIESEAKKFATPLGYKCVSIVGGRAVEEQQFNLREGAEIIIATPGRLKDVLERHVLVLSQCRYIVMDEADRMVHLGFEVDLTFILDALPTDTMEGEDSGDKMDVDVDAGMLTTTGKTRVTTLFSATMPAAVERLARKYLRKPAIITIGEAGRAVDTVEQRVEFVSGDEKKKQRVLEILNSNQYPSPIIVFVNQKKTADMVAKDLLRAGWSTSTLHSGKNQEQREAALQALRTGEADVLVATDLAGRGIDVQDVSLVINYQMAGTIEAYVHRIGRTGRAGKLGTAITLLTNDDDEVMYDLKQEISKSPVSKVAVELAKHESAQHKVSREMKRKRDADDIG